MEQISVIVPVYNVENYLMRCVDSVRKQTYKNLDIILVDDGSTDSCPELCDRIAREDSRIRVIHKNNGGLGFARNSGLEIVQGAYVTFVDSDDWISEDHIACLYQEAVRHQADLVIGGHTSIDQDGTIRTHRMEPCNCVYEGQVIVDHLLLPLIGADETYPEDVQLNSSSCMNLYRTEVIRNHQLAFISERHAVAEDLYFNIDYLFFSKRVVITDSVGYHYFYNPASISRKYNPKRFERTVNCYSKLRQQTEQYGLADRAAHRIERTYLMKIRVAIRHIVISDLPIREKAAQIQTILNHEITREALRRYPVHTYPTAIRLLSRWMQMGNVPGVYVLTWLREQARNQKLLRRVLRTFGIGR